MRKKLNTKDNVYTKKENEYIVFLKKSTSIESWFFFMLWSLVPFIHIKWAIWGSKRFPWAQPYGIVSLIFAAIGLGAGLFFGMSMSMGMSCFNMMNS